MISSGPVLSLRFDLVAIADAAMKEASCVFDLTLYDGLLRCLQPE